MELLTTKSTKDTKADTWSLRPATLSRLRALRGVNGIPDMAQAAAS